MTHPENTPASPDRRPLAPDPRELDERSARAWTEEMAVRPLTGGEYRVDSASGATYVVDLRDGGCTCPDHRMRRERCKHLRRVALEVTAGRVPPPGKRRGSCAACGLERFVPEHETPALCPDCHLERGDVATDRESGDPVVVARVREECADQVAIERDGEATTVADYPTNDGYPDDDLVVDVVYPFTDPERDFEERPRYAFPHSRLARRDEQLVA